MNSVTENRIRNFAILAHIDHGKSTLADRFLEITQTVEKRKMQEQFLDQMELEREKGITIKLQPVKMEYELEGNRYILNMIDTPGHIDFNYEVSRSLAAVEGAILLVDASQGIEAQTLTNLHIAQHLKLAIIPVINKIDLATARIEEVKEELVRLAGASPEDILLVSAKQGTGVEELLRETIRRVPPPSSGNAITSRALIFDLDYNPHKGVIAYIRIKQGEIKKGDALFLCAGKQKFEAKETGFFKPNLVSSDILGNGEIGYVATGIKEPGKVRVGDTITSDSSAEPLPGYQEPKPMVWANLVPQTQEEFPALKDAVSKLQLNDASFFFKDENLPVLGRGFRCGFLGLLHLEIIAERLKREFSANPVFTSPSAEFKIILKNNQEQIITSAEELPDPQTIKEILEPWLAVDVITPQRYLGGIMQSVKACRGEIQETSPLSHERIIIRNKMPLIETMTEFFNQLKSVSQGYGSMNYSFSGYQPADIKALKVKINGEYIKAFSRLVSKEKSEKEARGIVLKLRQLIPRQLFEIKIQAESGGRIIASERIPALRKDVTGYLYGGDRTRKMKLWRKQKKGKKKLAAIGKVDIPQEVFVKMLKR